LAEAALGIALTISTDAMTMRFIDISILGAKRRKYASRTSEVGSNQRDYSLDINIDGARAPPSVAEER